MKRACLALLVALVPAGVAHGKPPTAKATDHPAPSASAAPHVWTRPAPQLPMLPSLSRVRVEAARDHVTVVEELLFPRGDWASGGLDLYAAFGSPGTPVAVDARWVPTAAGAVEPSADDAGDPLPVEPAVRRTASTQLLLGPPQMAGVVVHVRDADLRRAYGVSDVAALRLRSLLDPPAAGAGGQREVVVRLGIAGGLPLTVGRVQVLSLEPVPWIARAEATLCGPEAEARPLALSLVPKLSSPPAAGAPAEPPILPAMAVRHASDDLCVRWWAPL